MTKLILTCGVFDVIHAGHIELFRWVKERYPEDLFVVAINSDESIEMLGREHINNYYQRWLVVSSIKYVDWVFEMQDTNPSGIIRMLKPTVFVKGPDYKNKIEQTPEYRTMRDLNHGWVEVCPGDKINSSSDIRKKLKASLG